MAKNIKDIADIFIIGDKCREAFLGERPADRASMALKGVQQAGHSHLFEPYQIGRLNPKVHVAMFCLNGEGEFIDFNGFEHSIKSNEIVFMPNSLSYSYVAKSEWKIFWVHLSPEIFKTDLKETIVIQNEKLVQRLNQVFLLHLDHTWDESEISQSIKQSCLDIIENKLRELFFASTNKRFLQSKKLEPLLNQIRETLHHNWTLKEMCQISHLSSAQLFRTTKSLYDMSPLVLVTDLRVQKAKILLDTTELKLNAICEMVGYENQFSFSRAFKKHSGVSPGEFRKRVKF